MASRAEDVAIYLSQHFHHVWDSFGFFDLQRLLYLAQGWHLASGRGLLFPETIGAHRAAPLVGAVEGGVPMHDMIPTPELADTDEDFLDSFCITYGVADREAVNATDRRRGGDSAAGVDAGHVPADAAGPCRDQPQDARESDRHADAAGGDRECRGVPGAVRDCGASLRTLR